MELGRHDPASDVLRLCSTRDWTLTINDLQRMAVSQTAVSDCSGAADARDLKESAHSRS